MTDPRLANLDAWRRVPIEDRRVLAAQLAAALGDSYTPLPGMVGAERLVGVRHACGLRLLAIPGGTYDMGMSDADEELLRACVNLPEPELAAVRAAARPVQRVEVAPFLCSQSPLLRWHTQPRRFATWLLHAEGEPYGDPVDEPFERGARPRGTRRAASSRKPIVVTLASARALAERLGLRLLAESEWEYVAPAGDGRWLHGTKRQLVRAIEALLDQPVFTDESASAASCNALGLWGLLVPGWVASGGWRGGSAYWYPWQAYELADCHVARRGTTSEQSELVAFVGRDLPALPSFDTSRLLADPLPPRWQAAVPPFAPGQTIEATVVSQHHGYLYLDLPVVGRIALRVAVPPMAPGSRIELVVGVTLGEELTYRLASPPLAPTPAFLVGALVVGDRIIIEHGSEQILAEVVAIRELGDDVELALSSKRAGNLTVIRSRDARVDRVTSERSG